MNRSARYLFDSPEAAAEALLLVLEDARGTSKFYRFGSTSFAQVYSSGLLLEGEIEDIEAKLAAVVGAARYDL